MSRQLFILLTVIMSLTLQSQETMKNKDLFFEFQTGVTKSGVWNKYKLHHFPSYTFQTNVNYMVGNVFKYGVKVGIHYSDYTDLVDVKTNYIQIPAQFALSYGKRVQVSCGLGVYYGFLTNESAPFNAFNSGFDDVNRNSFGFIESLSFRTKIKGKHSLSLWIQNKHDLTTQYSQIRSSIFSPTREYVDVRSYSLGFGIGYQYYFKRDYNNSQE